MRTTALVILLMAAAASAEEKIVRHARPVPGEYVVVLREEARGKQTPRQIAASAGAKVRHEYADAFFGFSASMPESAAAALSRHPLVELVEENAIVTRSVASYYTAQYFPDNWGLDRIDQRSFPLDHRYYYDVNNVGRGVHVYVIDTGINPHHSDFGGQLDLNTNPGAGGSVAFISGHPAKNDPTNIIDCDGHGTSVASLIAGYSYGVAKNATVHTVRVYDCNNTGILDNLLKGFDWVVRYHQKPAVVNFSSNFRAVDPTKPHAIEAAIRNLLLPKNNVTVVVSAGNTDVSMYENASYNVPGRMSDDGVIVVGSSSRATDAAGREYDKRSAFSAHSGGTDLYAPGDGVMAARLANSGGLLRYGTSFAAPHAAGVAALILHDTGWLTPVQVENVMKSAATKGIVSNVPGQNGDMLYRP